MDRYRYNAGLHLEVDIIEGLNTLICIVLACVGHSWYLNKLNTKICTKKFGTIFTQEDVFCMGSCISNHLCTTSSTRNKTTRQHHTYFSQEISGLSRKQLDKRETKYITVADDECKQIGQRLFIQGIKH